LLQETGLPANRRLPGVLSRSHDTHSVPAVILQVHTLRMSQQPCGLV